MWDPVQQRREDPQDGANGPGQEENEQSGVVEKVEEATYAGEQSPRGRKQTCRDADCVAVSWFGHPWEPSQTKVAKTESVADPGGVLVPLEVEQEWGSTFGFEGEGDGAVGATRGGRSLDGEGFEDTGGDPASAEHEVPREQFELGGAASKGKHEEFPKEKRGGRKAKEGFSGLVGGRSSEDSEQDEEREGGLNRPCEPGGAFPIGNEDRHWGRRGRNHERTLARASPQSCCAPQILARPSAGWSGMNVMPVALLLTSCRAHQSAHTNT